jgi:AcrR family transcriptional regulator
MPNAIDSDLYGLLLDSDPPDHQSPRRRRNKLAKVAAILDAARSLFAGKGFESATMEEIAERADVSKGTLYKYFPTKKTVVVSLFIRAQKEIATRSAAFLEASDPSKPIETMVDFERVLNETGNELFSMDLWRLIYMERMTDRAVAPGVVLSQIADSIMSDRIELLGRMQRGGSLSPDIDTAVLARILHAIGRFHWEEYISFPGTGLAATNRSNAADVRALLEPYVRPVRC